MKKIKIFGFLALSIFSSLLISCDEDDDYADTRIPKAVVSVNSKAVTAVEGSAITFTLTIDKPISKDIDFKLEYVSGTGGFRDYVSSGVETTLGESGFGQGIIGHKLVFPATATTATFTVTPVVDLFTEGTERVKLRLLPGSNGLGVIAADSEFIDVTINDFVSNNVGILLEWGQDTVDIHGTIFPGEYTGIDNLKHTYGLYDMDLFLEDSAGNEITGFASATGNPSEFNTLLSTVPNGDYFVYVDQYAAPLPNANPLLDTRPKVPFNKKMKVSLSKYGKWSTVVEIPFVSGANNSLNVVKIAKAGNVYTVTNLVTNGVIASGRGISIPKPIRDKINKRIKS